MTTARFTLVDVFTDTAFAGNQLGVFTDARGLTTEQMQMLARELNFSECTFVLPPEQGGQARMRIFTPAEELPFAGHPTLGTAWVLAAPLQRDVIELECGQGIVPVVLERDAGGSIVFGRMSQPLPSVEPYPHADALLAALGVVRSELPVELYDNGVPHVYVCVSSAEEVANLAPDMQALARLGVLGINCFAVDGSEGEDARVRARSGRGRGPGDRFGSRTACRASGSARAHRVGRRDRDLPGRRDRTPLYAVRTCRGRFRWRDRSRGRRLCEDRGPRRVQALAAADLLANARSTRSARSVSHLLGSPLASTSASIFPLKLVRSVQRI